MIIESNTKPYAISSDASLKEALEKISENKSQFVLLVSKHGVLEGILTDGDVRRFIAKQAKVDTAMPVSKVMNRDFTSARIDSPTNRIEMLFTHKDRFIPLVDARGRLAGIARPRTNSLKIGPFELHDQSPVLVVAEIGNNHNGSLELAKRLVDEAIAAGADAVKFQMRHLEELHRNKGKANDARADLGDQYTLDLLTRFQLSQKEFREIFDYVKKKQMLLLCTPFDMKSADVLEEYGLEAYKIASADLTNHELLERLSKTGKPLLCSTGMSMEDEVRAAVQIFRNNGAQYALLHCNSTYPAPLKDLNLNYLDRLKEIGNSIVVGYSGHELGINAALGAVGKGAKIIEKHFTLDRTMEGNDHRVSLLPDEFRSMVNAIRDIEQALGNANERVITQGERMNREVLGKSLVVNTDLKRGETIEAHMIEVKSPGQGLAPYRKHELVGRKARRSFKAGDFFFPQDILEGSIEPKSYHFDRPFGIPVRYHDFASVYKQTNLDLVEFHLSYKDVDEPLEKYLKGTYKIDFLVHAPELFSGDHTLDLCSSDEAYRLRSIGELQRVIHVTRVLKRYFPKTKRPKIIVNIGGFTEVAHLPKSERLELYKRLKDSLRKIDAKGVELIPQTMPPFPWHFGGKRHHNIFMDPAEIVSFCKSMNMRVCLDVSHSKLACTYYQWSFADFLTTVAPFAAHLHLVDASGVDGEGLQIGEGEIDFKLVATLLKKYAKRASFIPEIWQGHKNNGEGFWIALGRLEEYFGGSSKKTTIKKPTSRSPRRPATVHHKRRTSHVR